VLRISISFSGNDTDTSAGFIPVLSDGGDEDDELAEESGGVDDDSEVEAAEKQLPSDDDEGAEPPDRPVRALAAAMMAS